MDISTKLVVAAERLFDRHGYAATGMDRVTEAAEISSRTLYKRGGNKVELMVSVLACRERRFMRLLEVDRVSKLFAALETWVATEGSRGCLFLRTLAETGGDTPAIAKAVRTHKSKFAQRIADVVAADLGRTDPVLTEQVLVLFEGATHAAVYRGAAAIQAAGAAARILVDQART